MENKKININNLYIAQLRYFDTRENGTIVPSDKAYAVLTDITGKFENVINLGEGLPVYGRAPYSNTTLDGEDYGTKLYLLEGQVEDGLCYVLESYPISRIMQGPEVSIADVENMILTSDLLFKDRIDILKKGKLSKSVKALIASDIERLENFESALGIPKGKVLEKK